MGRFESYPATDVLNDSDITLYNHSNATSKITFANLVTLIKNKLADMGIISISAGVGLLGGTITSSGMIKCNLKSETPSIYSSTISTALNRQYAVGLDSDGHLSVNVPWEGNVYQGGSGISVVNNTISVDYNNVMKVDGSNSTSHVIFNDAFTSGNRLLNSTVGTRSIGVGYNVVASGECSYAIGEQTQATSNYAHAEGYYTTASEYASHTEGHYTTASGYASHAEGSNTQASGSYAHSEGYSTEASAAESHAEGTDTQASAYGAHSEGGYTQANGSYAHSEGKYTQTIGEGSHSEGCSNGGTINLGDNYPSDYDSTVTIPLTAIGSGSHTEGYVDVIENDSTIYVGSIQAKGKGAHAEGYSSGYHSSYYNTNYAYVISAYGDGSHAEGYAKSGNIIAYGKGSHAEGIYTRALGDGAHSEGYSTQAGNYGDGACHAEGSSTTATGTGSHAEGFYSKAYEGSHAEGSDTYANSYAHAEGYYTYATYFNGDTDYNHFGSHAEGQCTYARGSSHAEGHGRNHDFDYTKMAGTRPSEYQGFNRQISAVGIGSHAEGCADGSDGPYIDRPFYIGNIQANGKGSHAEGYAKGGTASTFIIASGNGSHAEGYTTHNTEPVIASGNGAHAEGWATKAVGEASHSEGRRTVANNSFTHAEGYGTIAAGQASHVEGKGSESVDIIDLPPIYDSDVSKAISAVSDGAHAEGCVEDGDSDELNRAIQASGKGSHAEGYVIGGQGYGLIIASGLGAHAEGYANCLDVSGDNSVIASGDGSHAEGTNTSAEGFASHAEGNSSHAVGDSSHAEGWVSTASGNSSHSEGSSTANGDYSHSEGYSNTANGNYSHVGGANVTANRTCQFVQGGYNYKFGVNTNGRGAFGVQPDGQHYNSNTTITDSQNGCGGTVTNASVTLQLSNCAMYLLCIVLFNDNLGTSTEALYTISTSKFLPGTPNITSVVPSTVTVNALANNQISILDNGQFMFHLIRLM